MLSLMDIASKFCITAMFVIIDLQTIFHPPKKKLSCHINIAQLTLLVSMVE